MHTALFERGPLQIKSLQVRESVKYGETMVLNTTEYAGNYTLGFRIDPHERLVSVFNEAYGLFEKVSWRPACHFDYMSIV